MREEEKEGREGGDSLWHTLGISVGSPSTTTTTDSLMRSDSIFFLGYAASTGSGSRTTSYINKPCLTTVSGKEKCAKKLFFLRWKHVYREGEQEGFKNHFLFFSSPPNLGKISD